jgi:hypothetical protein
LRSSTSRWSSANVFGVIVAVGAFILGQQRDLVARFLGVVVDLGVDELLAGLENALVATSLAVLSLKHGATSEYGS